MCYKIIKRCSNKEVLSLFMYQHISIIWTISAINLNWQEARNGKGKRKKVKYNVNIIALAHLWVFWGLCFSCFPQFLREKPSLQVIFWCCNYFCRLGWKGLKLTQRLVKSLRRTWVSACVCMHLSWIVYVFLKHRELIFQQLQMVLNKRQWQEAQGSQHGT